MKSAAAFFGLVLLGVALPAARCHAGQNEDGVVALQALSLQNLNLTDTLYQTILAGNLQGAKIAYAAARPPFSRMEVMAATFPDLDAAINQRASSFGDGDAFPSEDAAREQGTVYKGFHRIERLLFREGDVAAAEWWAAALVNSSVVLAQTLKGMHHFTARETFDGAYAAAIDVAKKKFSSEEETYSDLSILVFHNNFKGIQTQLNIYKESIAEDSAAAGAAVDKALADAFAALEPYTNKPRELGGVTPYSEVPMSGRAAIQKAAYAVATAIKGAETALGLPEVSQAAAASPDADPHSACVAPSNAVLANIKPGLDYFRALLPYELALIANFTAVVESGNLAAARRVYHTIRPIYEQVEVLAPAFLEQDGQIDAREYSYPNGELDEAWRGFHRIERRLFRDGLVDADTLAYAQLLTPAMEQVQTIYGRDSDFGMVPNFEGIIGLATEVVSKKISSEEETSSGLSQLIFYNNWKGIYSQVAAFLPSVKKETAAALRSAVRASAACLNITTTNDILAVSAADVNATFVGALVNANYGDYSDLSNADKECIAVNGYKIRDAIIAMAEELSVFKGCESLQPTPLAASPVLTYSAAQDAATVPSTIEAIAPPPEAAMAPSPAPSPMTSTNAAGRSQSLLGSAAVLCMLCAAALI